MTKCDQMGCNNEAVFKMTHILMDFHTNVCFTHYHEIDRESGTNWDLEKL